MMKLIPTVVIMSFVVISFYARPSSATAKINSLTDNELLETWKPSKNLSSRFSYYVSGFDNDRRPIFIIEFGKWPLREFVEKGGDEMRDLDRYIKQMFQRVNTGPRAFFNESEMIASDTATIIDWDKFGLTQFLHGPTLQYAVSKFANFQLIQESVAYGIWVNANSVASQFIALARPLLGSVFERVEVYGTQPSRFIPKILRRIPADQIPSWYGGEKEDFKPIAAFG